MDEYSNEELEELAERAASAFESLSVELFQLSTVTKVVNRSYEKVIKEPLEDNMKELIANLLVLKKKAKESIKHVGTIVPPDAEKSLKNVVDRRLRHVREQVAAAINREK